MKFKGKSMTLLEIETIATDYCTENEWAYVKILGKDYSSVDLSGLWDFVYSTYTRSPRTSSYRAGLQ